MLFCQALLLIVSLLLAAAGHAEIYKCTDEDGNVMYAQLPCNSEKPAGTKSANSSNPSSDDTGDEKLAEHEADEDTENPVAAEEQSANVAECKKRYRDAIDEIDAELSRDFQPEQAEAYKLRLLELTRKLRQC